MDKTLLDIILPGLPPTVNHVYRTGRGIARYKTAEGRRYQEQVVQVMDAFRKNSELWDGPTSVKIVFTSKNHLPWDVDNRIKVLQDCLAPAGVIKNDKQVVELYARRIWGAEDSTHIIVRGL